MYTFTVSGNRTLVANFSLGGQTVDLNNGLVGYYPFNENANDMSGNGLNGTVNGNVTLTTDRNNNPNSAYYFGGTINDWIEIHHNTLLNLSQNFSVSAWVFKESGSNNYVLGKGRDITCGTWSLGTSSISVDGSCGTSVSNPTTLNDNQWYMITGVLNSTTGKLRYYQDGQFITEVNSNSFTGNNTYPFAIGRHLTVNPPSYSEPWPYPFKGKIDDILIYNRALSDAEILQLYQSTSISGLPASAGIITGTAIVCQGQNYVTYTVPTIANATSYIWTLPSGATGTSTTNSITVNYSSSAVSGNISVQGSNTCGNGSISTYAVTVNNIPATPIITINGNVLHSNAPSGNQWYDQSGFINGATNQDYTVSVNGDYQVIVTLVGCSSEASNTINVILNDIEVVDNDCIIKVYPNPVSNELVIEIEGNNKKVNFDILNVIGQVVFKGNLVEKTTVQTSNFKPGLYIFKLKNCKTFEFKKIIKE